ncbi:MAG: hypothetical protein LRZ85_01170 [Alphaproteobacteria bacterium]|nr:hypothetical protein [Alphaproteobacteria bacterium]MCD8519916.1 hypothetical protein [Alphaproteobacteria bacterium]MCD8526532.1 hypothetical protein [Alphaproteobacteria bacterium]MCD8570828.1 hypothetical protein [Alphaproteobacteria bacterium]
MAQRNFQELFNDIARQHAGKPVDLNQSECLKIARNTAKTLQENDRACSFVWAISQKGRIKPLGEDNNAVEWLYHVAVRDAETGQVIDPLLAKTPLSHEEWKSLFIPADPESLPSQYLESGTDVDIEVSESDDSLHFALIEPDNGGDSNDPDQGPTFP